MRQRTTSETVFEEFLKENGLPFKPIPEDTTARPDYCVHIGDMDIIFEIKEISEDKNFNIGHGKVSGRTIGDHVRQKIEEARKQMQFAANLNMPSVLLIYNNLDPLHLFGTEDEDFLTAMKGEYTMLIGLETGKRSEIFHGKNKLLQENKNTSFSALGRMAPNGNRKPKVTIFENVHAKVRLPFEKLPACFEVKTLASK